MGGRITIIGAGLAGSEAAWQAAERGAAVELFEMRPERMTRAHRTGLCAELVCSNSLRGADLSNAVGLLKEELRRCGSLIVEAADLSRVPAGGALAVDRGLFSRTIDERIRSHPRITFITREVSEIAPCSSNAPLIIAAGPLASPALTGAIEQLTGEENLAFFDAISPTVLDESLDHGRCYRASRYDKGSGQDYLNVPLSKEDYYRFVEEVAKAEKHEAHPGAESDKEGVLRPFEGCMPIEDMVARGPDVLLYGPFKPVGLADPRTGHRPYAVLQLRQDDRSGALWSMVGMQTRMKQPEQQRIFRMLPGLEKAEFVRLGSVHRNTFINSPRCLNADLQFRTRPGLFFAGQITGTEGYVESTAGGFAAGINAVRIMAGEEPVIFPDTTALGALLAYVSDASRTEFQPMNISYGLMPAYLEEVAAKKKKMSKKDRRLATAEKALAELENFRTTLQLLRT